MAFLWVKAPLPHGVFLIIFVGVNLSFRCENTPKLKKIKGCVL